MDDDSKSSPKVSGYLDKKGKIKMMGSYKKYWFVLEGRLLLYYRSKDEYEAISPCKGSINLGPPCNVKPCLSLVGVFQIETRTNTVTLRAENREDQNRWMQGIISALNQNKNPTKLGHFRYSLDELPQQKVKAVLERKNTIPQMINSPKKQLNKGIIKRLQKIGAQSYGGSVGTINQIAHKKTDVICNSNSEESLRYNTADIVRPRSTLLIENDQYGVIRNSDIERVSTGNIYEQISNDSVFSLNTTNNYDNHSTEDKDLLRKISKDSLNSAEKSPERTTSFLLDNDTYGILAEKKEVGNKDRKTSFILENEQYLSGSQLKNMNISSEVIYAEPNRIDIDLNKNNLLVNNALNKPIGEENAYSVIRLYDTVNSNIEDSTNNNGNYIEIEDKESKQTIKNKNKVKKDKKNKHHKSDCDKNELKLKKKSSFMRIIWRKKVKHKEKEEDKDIEELYETVPASAVEKVCITDQTAVEMLSALQNILENKKPILIKRLSNEQEHTSPTPTSPVMPKLENTNKTHESNNRSALTHLPMFDQNTVQILSELQNILESKKNVLSAQLSDKVTETNTTEEADEVKLNRTDNCTISEPNRPSLPPKTSKKPSFSPYHDILKHHLLSPTKKSPNHENVKSIDEILDDLDNEDDDSNENKVKKLIKKFSDPEFKNEVILTTNKTGNYYREEMECDELGKLLSELAKVTSAPILTPGVTTSLITPNLTDEELLKLLPNRRRRHSDPDYDVPRPHKSLINVSRDESPSETPIKSTQFFGPVLQTSDVNVKKNVRNLSEDDTHLVSITPDSLELEMQPTKCIEDDKVSYTSHGYNRENKNGTTHGGKHSEDPTLKKIASPNFENSIRQTDSLIVENDIYAEPKYLHKFIENFKDTDNNKFYTSVKNIEIVEENDEVFIDSLEMNNSETSTAF